MAKALAVVSSAILGGLGGYLIGSWWLHRTVEAPELESAVYPGLGAVIGALLGFGIGLLVMLLMRGERRNQP